MKPEVSALKLTCRRNASHQYVSRTGHHKRHIVNAKYDALRPDNVIVKNNLGAGVFGR